MGLGDLNMAIELPSAEMWLTKADKTIIGKITQRSGIGFSKMGRKKKLIRHTQLTKLGSLSELEFSIPYQIEINHILQRNPIVDLVNESSLIKCIFNGEETWFVIVNIKKTMDDSKDILDLSCRSLNYELMRRYVRNFKVVSNNLSSLCLGGTTINSNGDSVAFSGILQGTLWGIGANTDATFDTIFRSFDISKATSLDALLQICKSFNAVPIFDTINRKINFQQIQNVGVDMGGKISYGNFMRSLENESKTDLLITRFVPYGKNGLTINSINGSIHVDDFSFFLKGFTQDINGNVLTSSPHMSDSLAKALTNYIALQASHFGEFSALLTTLSSQQVILTTKQNDMATLVTGLKSLNAQLDIAQTTGQPTATLLSQITSQNSLIATKQTEIDTANANIASTNASIATLQNTLSINNNLTQSQQTELIPFIREAEWTDNSISDSTSLYNQALVQFEKYKTPQIQIKVDMVNIWEDIKSQFSWAKFQVGNDITVEYNVLGSSVKAKIIELSFDHQGGNVQIVLANWSDIIRQNEAISKMIFSGISAANTLSVNVDSWGQIDKAAKDINAIYTSGIDSAKIAITSGTSNSILINNRGLTSTTTTDPNSLVRLNAGVLGFSSNGGNTFATAISAAGINAAVITGQLGQFVTLSASQITTGSLSGINMQIGVSPNLFQANTSGISLGATTWGAAPFRVDMSGNAWATSMTLTTPSITNGSIVGTSINIGSGNFTVSSGGALVAQSATITGTVNANSGTLGNLTVTGTLTGGTLTGATINTAASGRRITLNSNAMVTYDGSGVRRISLNDAGVQSNSSLTFYHADGNTLGMYIYQTGNQTVFNSGSDTIDFFGNVGFLNANNVNFANNSGVVNIPQSAVTGLATSLNGKLDLVNNSYVKTGASQDLKLQMFSGNLEVYLGGTYIGKVVPTP